MEIDVAALLTPVSDDEPTGKELPYEADRQMIERAFDRPFSIATTDDEEAEAEGEDWREIVEAIISQLGKTKDIWLAIYLARAGARWGRLEVVEAGVVSLASLLDLYWPSLYPALADGVSARAIACGSLSSRAEFLGPVERVTLIAHPRFGNFNGGDLQRFQTNGESEPNYGFFRNALEDLNPEEMKETCASIERIILALTKAEAIFQAHAGSEGPSFKAAVATFTGLRKSLYAHAPEEAAVAQSAAASEDGLDHGDRPAIASSITSKAPVEIASREDVLKALDAIIAYYRRLEPSSPVPLAIERARAWVTMPFMDILMDIAPNSRDDLERVLTLKKS